MNALTVQDAQRNLERSIEQATADFEPTIFIGAKGKVVHGEIVDPQGQIAYPFFPSAIAKAR